MALPIGATLQARRSSILGVIPAMNVSLQERFRGCLLGLAVGDALGGRFEAQSADDIRGRIPTSEQLINVMEELGRQMSWT